MTVYTVMLPQTRSSSEHYKNVKSYSRKPPKPPCWRDFISGDVPEPKASQKPKSDSSIRAKTGRKSSQIYFTDLSSIHKSTSEPSASGRTLTVALQDETAHVSVVPQQRKKGWRSKLRRTQSQSAINNKDLPNLETLTISLAETESEEFGLQRNLPFDPRLYMDQNVKRCEEWVQSVRQATEPFSLTDLDFDQGSGEELEIPEETWHDFREIKQEKTGLKSKTSKVHSSSSVRFPERTIVEETVADKE